MRRLRAAAVTAALLGAVALPALPAPPASAAPDLATQLVAATARAEALSDELAQAAARDGGLRVALQRLAVEQERAQARLDTRVRQVWIRRVPFPIAWTPTVSPALRRIAARGAAAGVAADRELVDAVAERSRAGERLQEQAQAFRAGLRETATAALAAQEAARVLLAQAEARAARQQADARAEAQAAERLTAVRASLDRSSAVLTRALTPAQTRRSLRAQATEAPLVALVEAAGSGYPQGYAPTGQVERGIASWYGPGFVGSPTASGSPYDPERLTCAHKALPLGTVVRVSARGRAVSCLVNDRGPFVAGRIVDLSRAGSRALGFDGVLEVVLEVLAPQ